jgi:hypothetical protein
MSKERETIEIYPSEALVFGLCVGEYLPKNNNKPHDPFVSILRRRLLPIIPSFRAMKENRAEYDLSKSLFDLILENLGESVALSKLEKLRG